jgi:hypothetical protein
MLKWRAVEVCAAPAYQAIAEALAEQARRVHQIAARNVRRVGSAMPVLYRLA